MNIFLHRVQGLCGEDSLAITFSREGDRNKLLIESSLGDLLLFVATKGKPTLKHLRGRLLGVAEIGREAKKSKELLKREELEETRNLDSDGNFRWPFAIPIIRVWTFENPPLAKDVLQNTYPSYGTHMLSERDTEAVMKLIMAEFDIGGTSPK